MTEPGRDTAGSSGLTIGLLAAGGRSWIAGLIYVQNLLRSLSLLPPEERPETVLMVGQGRSYDMVSPIFQDSGRVTPYSYSDAAPPWRRLAGLGLSVLRGERPGSLQACALRSGAQLLFPITNAPQGPRRLPWIGWIPDLQHHHHPEFWTAAQLAQRQASTEALLRRAPHVIVSSRCAHQDVMRFYPADDSKISVLPFVSAPSADWYADDPRAVAAHYGLPDKYLLFPAQFWAHKNHQLLFEAMRLLRDGGIGDIRLVCTGFTGDSRDPGHFAKLMRRLDDWALGARVQVLGLLPRHEQIQIMRCAAAVVHPSLFEGWSALVEDCRTLGKRLLLSDLPVHREQEPPRAGFFDPHDAQALADLIAAEWPRLEPGPDLRTEATERQAFPCRGRSFACAFLNLAERVL